MMRFLKPPQLLSAEELSDQAIACIREQTPESDSLDYKEELNVRSPKEKIELAKDVSSFANELGGTVIYGVPELKENDAPIPAPLEECGWKIDPRLPERVENILLDTIRPVLPNLFLRPLALPGHGGKQILVVHHPASWNKPHMVEAYGVRRYFRRGNYRAVSMSEREVEAAYASRRSVQIAAEQFFRTADLGIIPQDGRFLRTIVFPKFTLVRRERMREEEFREWLSKNPPERRSGEWIPFLDGVRFLSVAHGALHGKQFDLRYFHNGGASFTIDLEVVQWRDDERALDLRAAEQVIDSYFLIPAAKFFETLGIAAPLVLKVELLGSRNLEARFRAADHDLEKGRAALSQDEISFTEESSSEELLGEREKLLGRLAERLYAAFGLWR